MRRLVVEHDDGIARARHRDDVGLDGCPDVDVELRGSVGPVLGAIDVEIEPDDVETGGDGCHGEWQADVTLTDHDDALMGPLGVHRVAFQCPVCASERARTHSS